MQAPFFGALDALTIDDGGGRAGLPLGLLATLHIKCVVDILQCAVVGPQRGTFGARLDLGSKASELRESYLSDVPKRWKAAVSISRLARRAPLGSAASAWFISIE
jgi:hypothetical protein